jgi:hypothetical protein
MLEETPKIKNLPLEFGFWYLDWLNADELNSYDVWEKAFKNHPEYWDLVESLEHEPETIELVKIYADSIAIVKNIPWWCQLLKWSTRYLYIGYELQLYLEKFSIRFFQFLGFKIKYGFELPWYAEIQGD